MDAATLFLDQSFRPLRIEPWQRAIADFFSGKVEVVSYSEDRMIQGIGRTYPMPSVVRVLRHFKRDKIRLKFSRLNIYARDRFECQFCGERKPTEELTFDHVTPRSRGGKTSWENIVTCCVACNSEKANRTPEEAGMKLLRKPVKPKYLPSIQVRGMGAASIPDDWKPYWIGSLES